MLVWREAAHATGRKMHRIVEEKIPPYEIKEWNEDNFDVYAIPYIREAYEQKKYAFVSDYARFSFYINMVEYTWMWTWKS